jgi:pimeloyl-ACP methyl ester carboxylesterase
MSVIYDRIAAANANALKVGAEGRPTVKALEYATACQDELAKSKTSAVRRAELKEDLGKLERAHFVVLNQVNHYYLDEGPVTGIPVILIHGWDCSSFWWHSTTRALNAAGYRTINYDLRGHGFSDDPVEDDYRVATMVKDLTELAEHLGLEKFHLFSFSVGAVVAAAFAAQYPEKVASLAFFNFGLWSYNPRLEKIGPRALSTVFGRVLKKVKAWQPVYGYVRLTLVKNPVARRDIQYGMLSLKDTSVRASYHAAHSVMSKEVLTQLPGWAKKLTMPVLLVPGSHDKVISLKSAKRLADLLPNCTFFVMPHCGHLILGELPDQVAALLKMHLERVGGIGGK